jgi:hypothetical protein
VLRKLNTVEAGPGRTRGALLFAQTGACMTLADRTREAAGDAEREG